MFINKFFQLALSLVLVSSCIFSGEEEEELDRIKFLGSYSVFETCNGPQDSYQDSYTINITTGFAESEVILNNLYDWEEPVIATVSGNNLIIPPQTWDDLVFNGNGSLSGNTLTVSFTILDGFYRENCFATCTKR